MNRRKFLKFLGGVPLLAAGTAIAAPAVTSGFRFKSGVALRVRNPGELYGRSPAMTATEILRTQNQIVAEFAKNIDKEVIRMFDANIKSAYQKVRVMNV